MQPGVPVANTVSAGVDRREVECRRSGKRGSEVGDREGVEVGIGREWRWEIGREREPEEGEVEWKRREKERKGGSEGEKNKWREGWMSWYAG